MASGFIYKTVDIIQNKYGRLTVIEDLGIVNKRRKIKTLCECGIITEMRLDALLSGRSKSCGCLQREIIGDTFRKHGLYNHPIWNVWKGMIRRCYSKTCKEYVNYGAKGVLVCAEWKNDFTKFADWALKNGWVKGLQLDKDKLSIEKPGKLYSSDYCCFLTSKENNQNKSTNIMLTYMGETLCAKKIAEKIGMSNGTFNKRLKLGWTIDDIINTPIDYRFSTKKKLVA
jgi:hypothetical protein